MAVNSQLLESKSNKIPGRKYFMPSLGVLLIKTVIINLTKFLTLLLPLILHFSYILVSALCSFKNYETQNL